jgi:SAM-dependent methyltransferase
MRAALMDYLACPRCGGTLGLRDSELEDDTIVAGTLVCEECPGEFPIVKGVPRMNVSMDALETVARYFTYEWRAYHHGAFEHGTLFGRTPKEDWEFFLRCMGATPAEIANAVVLDAGCGSGRFAQIVGQHGARVVIGVDIIDTIEDAADLCSDMDNVHIVQANLFALPFKTHIFDFVWCSGVLHHTPDAGAAHRAVVPFVSSGGTFYVWVYAKRFNPFRFVKSSLDVARVTRLPEEALFRLSKAISYPSFLALEVYRAIRRLPPLRPQGAWGHSTVRPRTIGEIQLTWFDALSPQYDTRHTEEEVVGWFEREGFEDIVAIDEPKVGVRGRAPRRDPAAAVT